MIFAILSSSADWLGSHVTLTGMLGFGLLSLLLYHATCILYRLFLSPLRSIPGPWYASMSSFWLNIQLLRTRRIHAIHNLFKVYGPVVRISPRNVMILDVPSAKHIWGFSTKLSKDKFYKAFAPSGIDHAFTLLDHASHAMRKKAISAHHTFANLLTFEPDFHICVVKLLDFIQTVPTGQSLDTLLLFRHLLIDSNCAHLFDFQSRSLAIYFDHIMRKGPEDQISIAINDFPVKGAIKTAFPTWLWPIVRRLPHFRWQEMLSTDKVLYKFVSSLVSQIKEVGREGGKSGAKGGKQSLASRLLHQTYRPGEELSDEDVIAECTGHIVAGTDTTSLTLSFLLFELTQRPNVLRELQAEVDSFMPNKRRIPDYKVLRRMPYLNAVISEGLRLYAAVPSPLERIVPSSTEPFKILGYTLPADSVIGAQLWSIHRQPEVFHDPDEFLPKRWLERGVPSLNSEDTGDTHAPQRKQVRQDIVDKESHSTQAGIFPFGYGPRTCAGQNVAMIFLSMSVCALVRNFDIIAPPETNKESMAVHEAFVILPAKEECKLTFVPRGDYIHLPDTTIKN